MKRCGKNYPVIYSLKRMLITVALINSISLSGQQIKIDSLNKLIANTKTDTAKIDLYEKLGDAYRSAKKMDSCILSFQQALKINEKNNYSLQHQCWNMAALDYILYEMGNYTESLKYAFDHLTLSKKINDTAQVGSAYLVFGHDYRELGNYRLSLDNYFKAYHYWEIFHAGRHEPPDNTYTILCISETYLRMNNLDSAFTYAQEGNKLATAIPYGVLMLLSERILGDIYLAKGDDKTALYYYRQYVPDYTKYKERNRDLCFVLNNMAKIFQKANQNDSAVLYAKEALNKATEFQDQQNIYDASNLLYNIYDDKNQSNGIIAKKTKNIANNNKEPLRTKIDRLKKEFLVEKSDSLKGLVLGRIAAEFEDMAKMDSAIIYAQQQLEFVQKNKLPVQREIWALAFLDHLTTNTNNYTLSLQYATRALHLSEQIHDNLQIGFANSGIAAAYVAMGDLRKALYYYFKTQRALQTFDSGQWGIENIAETYLKMHMPDSALYYNNIAYHIANTYPKEAALGNNQQYNKDFAIRVFGGIYAEKGDDKLALKYYKQFVDDFSRYNLNNREIDFVYLDMAKIYRKNNKIDSSVSYAKKSLEAARIYNDEEHILAASQLLYNLNDSLNDKSQALQYFKIAEAAKDSMASIEKIRQIQSLTFNEEVREKQQAEADAKTAAKTKLIIIISSIVAVITAFLIWLRIRQLRLKYQTILEQKEAAKIKAEYGLNKAQMERQILELEAKALRAQMNPHFIFNCMNSIKALIQEHEEDKAITYLITFSKLIRTIFNNSDKREISLFDEIETCKLYTQLESMRFKNKFDYVFDIDETVDMKSISVPALIIQPFIENAIWHGIMPKDNGGYIHINIKNESEAVFCMIDDNGIGREMSKQNKFKTGSTHNSKGMHLTQSRIDLDNLINNRNASLEIIDKKDEDGNAAGTSVTLIFKKY